MAKLNGVTAVSERIQYNGAEYVKSDEAAVVGDIIRFDDSSSCVTTGGFYEVTRIDSFDDPQVTDDDGDEFDLCGNDFTVFKRVEAAVAPTPPESPAPTLTDQYVIHDGKVYVKEARKATKGDTVIVTKVERDSLRSFSLGDIGTVTGRRGWVDADIHVKFTSGNEKFIGPSASNSEYNVLVPTDTVTIDGVEYTLEKRKAAKGDRVLVVTHFTYGKSGQIADVEMVYGDGDVKTPLNERMLPSRYIVLAPKVAAAAQPKYREVKRKANVGERIRIVSYNCGNHAFPDKYVNVGDEFTVESVDRDGDVWYVKERKIESLFYYSCGEYVVLEPVAPDAKKAETKSAEPEPRLKVGEYAKVIRNNVGNAMAPNDIVEITYDDGGKHFPYKAKRVSDGKTSNWIAIHELVRATDAEVAEAKRKAAKAQFSVGDTVKLVSGGGKWPLLGFEDGKLYEIVNVSPRGRNANEIEIKKTEGRGSGYATPDKIIKLTPAEAEQARKEQAEAAAKAAEEAKWAKIGRKVNEFKAGDIVTVNSNDRYNGVTGRVEDIGDDLLGIREFNGKYRGPWKKDCVLLAPVESLFSRQEA
ncbi:hypothetical protein [Paenibacillus planticolens]|uniref:Uncharacterized protein n=1 Tax=Paenibacillus planticolens TaxID=2654976 RepID=A0ABX1ZED0_9BACL|nr:hypothetical protein [Paenibacillus planticolens]NOU98445.1 hypothetical protein [Paenibacillus planticolens]